MSTDVIRTRDLTKTFRLYDAPVDRLKEALNPFGRKYHRDFHALRDVNIHLAHGECVGIIGLNGSGKSTLLQLIAGVLTPSAGEIEVGGRIAALLELGAGFNPEFTGIDNVVFQCSIMGYKRNQIDQMLPAILEFADIGEFVNHPVKTYSSGMYVRLAFSVAINVSPDVLIVDEALAVGDIRFQAKCMAKIREFRRAGKALLFVSHDAGAVKSLCDRAYLLDRGKVVDEGSPERVFNFYNSLIAERDADAASTGAAKDQMRKRSGTGQVRIERVRVVDSTGAESETFSTGAMASFELDVSVHEATDNPTFGILIRDRLGNDIYGTNSHNLGRDLGRLPAGARRRLVFTVPLELGQGVYTLTVAAHCGQVHVEGNYDWINDVAVFRVVPAASEQFTGVCRLRSELKSFDPVPETLSTGG